MDECPHNITINPPCTLSTTFHGPYVVYKFYKQLKPRKTREKWESKTRKREDKDGQIVSFGTLRYPSDDKSGFLLYVRHRDTGYIVFDGFLLLLVLQSTELGQDV